MNKDELKKTMTEIFDNILADAAKDAETDPLFEFIASKKEWLGDPEEMDVMIHRKYHNIIGQVVAQTYGVNDHMLTLIYTHWAFFDNIVTELTSNLEGTACCTDRARTILKSFIEYRVTGKMPVWQDNYRFPDKGEPYQWMEFVEGVGGLYNGNPSRYLMAFMNLTAENSKDE